MAGPRPLLIDGGLATELEAAGHRLADRLWSGRLLLDDPGAIARVHRAYVDAGADVLLTATYQLADEPLRARGLDDASTREIYELAVGLAHEARGQADRSVQVAGSVGSFGASLPGGEEYRGSYLRPGATAVGDAELSEYHRSRLCALLGDPRVDLIVLETFPGVREVELLLDLCQRTVEALGVEPRPIWASLSCLDDERTAAGDALVEVGQRLGPRVAGLGVNCTDPRAGRRQLDALARGLGRGSAGLLIYPNAGEAYAGEAASWCGPRLAPAEFAELARAWIAQGVMALGGCCRTTPAHIAALRRQLDADP